MSFSNTLMKPRPSLRLVSQIEVSWAVDEEHECCHGTIPSEGCVELLPGFAAGVFPARVHHRRNLRLDRQIPSLLHLVTLDFAAVSSHHGTSQ